MLCSQSYETEKHHAPVCFYWLCMLLPWTQLPVWFVLWHWIVACWNSGEEVQREMVQCNVQVLYRPTVCKSCHRLALLSCFQEAVADLSRTLCFVCNKCDVFTIFLGGCNLIAEPIVCIWVAHTDQNLLYFGESSRGFPTRTREELEHAVDHLLQGTNAQSQSKKAHVVKSYASTQ